MQKFIQPPKEEWESILERPALDLSQLEATVSNILADIKMNGDAAIKKYTAQFDKAELSSLMVSEEEFAEAEQLINDELKAAIKLAYKNIRLFHSQQELQTQKVETMPGVNCWRKSVAIEKVGLYIPGGTAPLFSTVLMLAVPAKIAGCKEIVLCTPPNREGKIHPAILFTANLVGVNKVFKAGGVQAIGGMNYGTESIPKVYKVFGPGNQYVTAAKQMVSRLGTAIDMPAGPSEVLVYADESAHAGFVAADLLSQAEHGVDSQVVLVANQERIVDEVLQEINNQLEALPRKEIAQKALANSVAIVLPEDAQSIDLINEYAPEHLILSSDNADEISDQITNAGSVFLGHYTPESVGDYASGTNHTLPTNGYARMYSGVSLDSFVKKITYQRLTKEGIKNLGPAVELMASAEELDAHKQAVSIRLASLKSNG
ncbi:MAG: histidinol dehydrogenase [Bacteroidota bacterium]